MLNDLALRRDRNLVVLRSAQKVPYTLQLVAANQRPDIEIIERRSNF